MENSLAILLLAVLLAGGGVHTQSTNILPSDFPVCDRLDPQVNECLKRMTSEWIEGFSDGIESLNVTPLDPLKLGRVSFRYANDFIRGVVALKKSQIVGFSKVRFPVMALEVNSTSLHGKTALFAPRAEITASYRAEGSLAGITMQPHGFLNITVYNITLTNMIEGHIVNRDNGYGYFVFDSVNTTAQVDWLHFNVTGITTDELTNDVMVDIVNKNWRQIFDTVIDETVTLWQPYVVKRINRFLDKVPTFKN